MCLIEKKALRIFMMQTEIGNRTNNYTYKISKAFKSKSNQSSIRILQALSYTLY